MIAAVAESGAGVLLIEQFATVALGLAHHAHIMEGGRIRFSGLASELRDHPDPQAQVRLSAPRQHGRRRRINSPPVPRKFRPNELGHQPLLRFMPQATARGRPWSATNRRPSLVRPPPPPPPPPPPFFFFKIFALLISIMFVMMGRAAR